MKLLSQRGVSIIQALMVSAVLAGMALVGTSLLKDQKMAQKGTQTADDITLLHQLVTSIIQDKKHCTATLLANQPQLTAGNWKSVSTGTPITSIVTVTASGSASPLISSQVLPSGQRARYMNGNIEVTGIRINYSQRRFEIDYERVNKSTTAKVVTKTIPDLTFKLESSVDTCYTDSETANNNVGSQFCTSLGDLFVWNPTIKDCILREQVCANDEVFIGVSSLGKAICRNTANYADWQNLLDTSASCNPTAANTNVSLQVVGGKIRIVCTPTGGGGTTGCTPINGGWTAWTNPAWGTCTAGSQSRTLTRSCTNPTPNTCGAPCPADAYGTATSRTETQACGAVVDCSSYETPINETGGCVALENVGPWYDVSADCQCRDVSGTFYVSCNYPDGMRYGTLCQPK